RPRAESSDPLRSLLHPAPHVRDRDLDRLALAAQPVLRPAARAALAVRQLAARTRLPVQLHGNRHRRADVRRHVAVDAVPHAHLPGRSARDPRCALPGGRDRRGRTDQAVLQHHPAAAPQHDHHLRRPDAGRQLHDLRLDPDPHRRTTRRLDDVHLLLHVRERVREVPVRQRERDRRPARRRDDSDLADRRARLRLGQDAQHPGGRLVTSSAQPGRRPNYAAGVLTAGWLVIVLAPIYVLVKASLQTQTDYNSSGPLSIPDRVTASNFGTVIHSGFLRYFVNTGIITAAVVAIVVVLVPPVAFAIVRNRSRTVTLVFRIFLLG